MDGIGFQKEFVMHILVKYAIAEYCFSCDHFDETMRRCSLFNKALRRKRTNFTENAFQYIRSRKCWNAQRAAEKLLGEDKK